MTQAQFNLIVAREADIEAAYEAGRIDLLEIEPSNDLEELSIMIGVLETNPTKEGIKNESI